MTRFPRKLIDRARDSLPFRVVAAFGESQAANYAGALAFAGFLAMFPMMLGMLSIIGLAIRDPATEARFQTLIIQSFPADAEAELLKALHGVKQSAGWIGLVSLGGLIWSATGIFGAMEFALTQIFGTKQRDMLRQKLMALVMMVVLVVGLGITVAANWAAGYLSGRVPYAWVLSFVIGAAVMVTLLVLLYRFVPNRTFSVRDVLPGALLAGVLIEALSLVFPLYARFAGGFNTYGAQFGLFFLLATWLYLLSELMLLGAVYNRFRLGQPATKGLIASPRAESHEPERPVDVIRRKKATVSLEQRPPVRNRNRSIFQRAALGLFVGAAVASSVIRRRTTRGRHSVS
ncbi:MAG TPA: YihY/virulence factor BrkB family protein [Candidatus Nitrosotalea sp.]|nr:YihY/virulence factor BrkB family protein [Candidatus Nitrosotalea sp.]